MLAQGIKDKRLDRAGALGVKVQQVLWCNETTRSLRTDKNWSACNYIFYSYQRLLHKR